MEEKKYQVGKKYHEADCYCGGCRECCKCCECCECCECLYSSVSKLVKGESKRSYVDILNMSDQKVGKLVRYFDKSECCCCSSIISEFYEIYFPPDANLLLKLTFICQMIYSWDYGYFPFGLCPGTTDDLDQFIA